MSQIQFHKSNAEIYLFDTEFDIGKRKVSLPFLETFSTLALKVFKNETPGIIFLAYSYFPKQRRQQQKQHKQKHLSFFFLFFNTNAETFSNVSEMFEQFTKS